MAQGKAWKKEKVIEALEPYFKLGCSINKACSYAGVPQSTVQTWLETDDELRLKIGAWQNEVSLQVAEAINWLSKKEKDEFADRRELTGEDGGAIKVQGVEITIRK